MMGLPVGETVCRTPHEARKKAADSNHMTQAKARGAAQLAMELLRGGLIARRAETEIGARDLIRSSSKK